LNEQTPLFSAEPADENIVGAPDWTKIEAEYRAGKPLREIAAQFGVGKSTIYRRAKQKGWQKIGTSPRKDAGNTQEMPGTNVVVPRPDDANDHLRWDSDEDVVIHEQPRTVVYFNPDGALVIRQVNQYFDDPFVFIAPEYFESFMEKLSDLLGIPLGRKSS
jgi:hypothetical protein